MSYPKIRKAVFPAAGLGTRFLPATKAIPKEMLCLVDKPLIQYGVEEAVAAGCTEIIIVTGRDKAAMEDHFDYSPELGAAISAYGCLDCAIVPENPRLLAVKGMVEKPKPEEAPSQNAIIGRYILTPRIFEMIEKVTPGAGGELQLTDAIKALLQYEKVYGFQYEGKRHDAGDKLGFLKATVELALKRDDLGPGFREWLKEFPI